MVRKESSSCPRLKREHLKELMLTTQFNMEEVDALYSRFRSISSSHCDDGFIDRNEFRQALGLKDSLFVDRLFQLFDEDEDGKINYAEFIYGLSILSSRGPLDEKILFSFRLYDFDNDNRISHEELTKMLSACLFYNNVHTSPAQIELIIRSTFEASDTNGDGFIDFEEYKALVQKNPSILSCMTLDMSTISVPK